MILRNKRINTNSDMVQLSVSYSSVDVKDWLKYYANLFLGQREAQEIAQTENSIRYWLEHDPRVLANYMPKWREQLSAWAWATAVRCGYLVQSVTPSKGNEYYLADCLFAKLGRPTK